MCAGDAFANFPVVDVAETAQASAHSFETTKKLTDRYKGCSITSVLSARLLYVAAQYSKSFSQNLDM